MTFFAGANSRWATASPWTEWWLWSRPVASPEVAATAAAVAGEAVMSFARSSMLEAVFLSAAMTGLRRVPGFAAVMDTVEADIGIVENRLLISNAEFEN